MNLRAKWVAVLCAALVLGGLLALRWALNVDKPSVSPSAAPEQLLAPMYSASSREPSTTPTNIATPLRARAETTSPTRSVAASPGLQQTLTAPSSEATAPSRSQRSQSRTTVGFTPPWLDGGGVNPLTGQPERELIGIGAVLMRENGAVRVRDVISESPAALANLSGFIIERVDDISLADVPLEQCVLLIRGPEGTAVTLEVIDPAQQRKTLQIVRNKVKLVN